MYARLIPASHESVYDAIARWAASAPSHLLRVLLWSGALGAAGVIAVDAGQWYLGVGMAALAALGAWGLVEHRLAARYSRGLQALVWIVAAMAAVAALVAVGVGLFVFLGPAPHF